MAKLVIGKTGILFKRQVEIEGLRLLISGKTGSGAVSITRSCAKQLIRSDNGFIFIDLLANKKVLEDLKQPGYPILRFAGNGF
ncbi:MAG: hypothetical protein IBX55_00580 [Methyloprofundus sp.]|nr:hypothetical protein [Methyloprofundus sp.]